MVALLVVFAILVFLTVDFFLVRRKPLPVLSRAAAGEAAAELPAADKYARIPTGATVCPGHLWLWPQPNGLMRVGPDPVLLALLGEVEYFYPLPDGSQVRRGGPLAMLRRGNRALKLRSPVSGRIAQVNERVSLAPERLTEDPVQDIWLYELEPTEPSRARFSESSDARSSSWLREEAYRLRELILYLAGRTETGQLVLADGGLPMEELDRCIRDGLVDSEWEELVSTFFAGTGAHGAERS